MQYVRLLNINRYYSPTLGRFTSQAFRKFEGGISVFSAECAKEETKTICDHIAKNYSKTAGDPAVFWLIDEEKLKKYPDFLNKLDIKNTTENGDKCHYDIIIEDDNKDKKAARFLDLYCTNPFRDNDIESQKVYLCCENRVIKLTKSQYEDLINTAKECSK